MDDTTTNSGNAGSATAASGATATAGDKIAAGLKDAAPKAAPQQQEEAKAPANAATEATAEAKPGDAEELKALRDRLAKLESQQDEVQKLREADDAVDSFIRDRCPDMPRELMRKLLPRTKDTQKLQTEAMKITQYFHDFVKVEVKAGRLSYRNIGGDPGGRPIEGIPLKPASTYESIRAGLQRR